MGWGAKKRIVAMLQPLSATGIKGDEPIDNLKEEGLQIYALDHAPVEPEIFVADDVTPEARAEIAWLHLQANKGWMPEQRERVLREFIKKQGMYPALLAYAKGLR